MKSRRIFLFSVLIISFLFQLNGKTNAESGIGDVVITNIDPSDFPLVNLKFRALDLSGFPAQNIQKDIFQVKENGVDISPEDFRESEEGLWLHFVIDGGVWLYGQSWTNMKEAIRDFVQTTPWMKENVDYIALTVVEGGTGRNTLVTFTTDGKAITDALDAYTPKRGTTVSETMSAMSELLDEMASLEEAVNKPRFIIFLTSGLETDLKRDDLAQKAIDLKIPIYTVMTSTRDTEAIEDLASKTGGLFTKYVNRASMTTSFQQLVKYRKHYELVYSSGVNFSGNIPVELIANVGAGSVSANTNYDIEVFPPRVLITKPVTGEVIRDIVKCCGSPTLGWHPRVG